MTAASISLRLGTLSSRIDLLGAELRSLRRGDDELLWQDEAAVWPHAAPVLFPVVGRLRGGGYLHGGQFYAMPTHGFAGHQRFELIAATADSLLLELRANAATWAMYPFEFRLRVRFTLSRQGLEVAYTVINEGEQPMCFALGSHPGFALAGDLSDWHLQFDQAEVGVVWRLCGQDNALLAAEPEPFTFDKGQRINLHPSLFARDALIFKHIRSRCIGLVHRERGVRLQLDTGGAPHLGLWARPGAAYVCIEPWFGVDEDRHAKPALADKPQLMSLAAGARFETRYQLVLPAL